VCLLAVWRLTHLFVFEDGPFDVIVRLRTAVGNGFPADDGLFTAFPWVAAPSPCPWRTTSFHGS
jgi:hypothetical protein